MAKPLLLKKHTPLASKASYSRGFETSQIPFYKLSLLKDYDY